MITTQHVNGVGLRKLLEEISILHVLHNVKEYKIRVFKYIKKMKMVEAM